MARAAVSKRGVMKRVKWGEDGYALLEKVAEVLKEEE